jgi:hypothetical protein
MNASGRASPIALFQFGESARHCPTGFCVVHAVADGALLSMKELDDAVERLLIRSTDSPSAADEFKIDSRSVVLRCRYRMDALDVVKASHRGQGVPEASSECENSHVFKVPILFGPLDDSGYLRAAEGCFGNVVKHIARFGKDPWDAQPVEGPPPVFLASPENDEALREADLLLDNDAELLKKAI